MGKELLFDQNTSILSLIYMIFGAIVFLLFVTKRKTHFLSIRTDKTVKYGISIVNCQIDMASFLNCHPITATQTRCPLSLVKIFIFIKLVSLV